jgi:hypothetical protein
MFFYLGAYFIQFSLSTGFCILKLIKFVSSPEDIFVCKIARKIF